MYYVFRVMNLKINNFQKPFHNSRVTQYSEHNRMHTANLAIVFGPTLLWAPAEQAHNIAIDCIQQNNVVEVLLNDFKEIFAEDTKTKKKAWLWSHQSLRINFWAPRTLFLVKLLFTGFEWRHGLPYWISSNWYRAKYITNTNSEAWLCCIVVLFKCIRFIRVLITSFKI